ncbi:MAG: polyprenyl synthetase family protein [Clostridiales bacterium]|nr:polyprenyl synthetase family protein [Clostridiales bacterium]
MTKEKFNLKYNEYLDLINHKLELIFDSDSFRFRKSDGLERMLECMKYSVFSSGKRIRPVLCLAFCDACGGDILSACDVACAIEMIHTYSLIHDDLPCMDNDDFRRGRPSSHKQFGEADALLAGDSLLTFAFEVVCVSQFSDDIKCKCIFEIAKSAGPSGMIAGQVMDLQNESRLCDIDRIMQTDNLKTGELICVSSKAGCIIAGADTDKINSADIFGQKIGLAFQVVDDILDVTSTYEELGKPIGSDINNNKQTYVSLLGLKEADGFAKQLTREAVQALDIFGDRADFLKELAFTLCARRK